MIDMINILPVEAGFRVESDDRVGLWVEDNDIVDFCVAVVALLPRE